MPPLWAYKLMPVLNRWTNAAPAACCGACRACATATATNAVAASAGIALEVVGVSLGRRDDAAEDGEAATEP